MEDNAVDPSDPLEPAETNRESRRDKKRKVPMVVDGMGFRNVMNRLAADPTRPQPGRHKRKK